ncbi:MAG: glycosyl hydrolase [Bacteroidia bacterium]|nr:glycosyl hydrolase [Bacteroidia bacterium]
MKRIITMLALVTGYLSAGAQNAPKVTSSLFGMMEARSIGPAVMGGRITSIDANVKDPRIVYVGTAGGGIWKTINGGASFKSVFDKYCQSIGALTIDQGHPETIWAGTGESNMRNSVSIGNGIYLTTDGGDNWTRMGLDSTEHIARILIHPRDPKTVYVAAPGPLWSDSPHRGLYKTSDGGKTWEKILYTDVKTGCAEVVMDPSNPDVLYASMWQFRRKPFAFASGGPGSALYKSSDGGKTWKKLTKGLPTGEIGRVALALAPSAPSNLFAIVEAKKTSLYLSTDSGESWQEQSSNFNVEARPFYFSTIAVDPANPKRVYRPAFSMSFSDDGGRSWSDPANTSGWVHSDHHAIWINPANPSQIYLGTDGGVYMSLDRANNFIFLNNIPVGQFYHVEIDNGQPYNVFGGLQDNGSWMGPSQSIGGIENGDWMNVGGGDGFWVQRDRLDSNFIYSEYQGGHAFRVDLRTNEYADIQPKERMGDPKFRFNWNTPLYLSPNDPSKLYMGAQFLFLSRDRGRTWERISSDLTTNDPNKQKQEESGGVTTDNSSAENHCTIFTIAESPIDGNQIWVGTDDGNLQVSTDGGKTWTKVNGNIKGMPAQTWVSSIEPSRFDKNTVYATFDNHMYGDMNTYAAVSKDLGKTWTTFNLSELKAGFAHKIREDLINRNLLWLGTEWGLHVSLDGGSSWTTFNAKVPPTPVRDIQIHPKTNDLVLATHGRSILVVDDISPLRQLTSEVMSSDLAFLPTRDFAVSNGRYGGAFPSAGGYVGQNSSEDAQIIYYLKDRVTTGDLKIEIFDASGKSYGTVPATKRKGINKISWGMRQKPPRVARGVRLDGAGFFGPLCEPGSYTVKLTKGDKTYSHTLRLVEDMTLPHSMEDRSLQRKTVREIMQLSEELALLTEQVWRSRDDARAMADSTKNGSLKKSLTSYADKMEKVRKELIATKEGQSITGEERLREKTSELYGSVAGYLGRPNTAQMEKFAYLRSQLNDQQKAAKQVWDSDLVKLNTQLKAAGFKSIDLIDKAAFDKMDNTSTASGGKQGYTWTPAGVEGVFLLND